MKVKIIVFGTGKVCPQKLSQLDENTVEIVAFADNDTEKVGSNYRNVLVIHPDKINQYVFDYIVIATTYENEIINQLLLYGIPIHKIIPYSISNDEILRYKQLFNIKEIMVSCMKKMTVHVPDYLELSYQLDSADFIRKNFANERGNLDMKLIFGSANEYWEAVLDRIPKDVIVNKKGLFLEFGVYKGTSINRLAGLLSNNTIYGFDSFEGLPEDWRIGRNKGMFSLNGNLPKVRDNVRLIKGWFEETLPNFINEHKEESCILVHIDCDLYSSTKTVLERLRNKIVPGTILLFDELIGYVGWQEHEYRAFMEFVTKYNISYEYIAAIQGSMQVAVQIK